MLIFNSYLSRQALGILIFSLGLISLLIGLVDFVEALRAYETNSQFTYRHILALTLLKMPSLMEQILPFVVLFAIIFYFHTLNRHSELVCLRAAGISTWQLLQPMLCLCALFGLIWSLLVNPLAQRSLNMYKHNLIKASELGIHLQKAQTVWLRDVSKDQLIIIKGQSIDIRQKIFTDANFWVFRIDDRHTQKFHKRYKSYHALWTDQGWQLTDVHVFTPEQHTQSFTHQTLPVFLPFDQLITIAQQKNRLNFWQYPKTIRLRRKAGYQTHSLILDYNRLLALPLYLTAMGLVAAALSLYRLRHEKNLRFIILGGMIGFLAYSADKFISVFAHAGILSPVFSAWVMPLIIFCLSFFYISKRL